MKPLPTLLACALLLVGSPGAAQAPSPAEPNEVEAVVVIARRIGVPVWRVSDGDSTLVLVGHINGVPKNAPWRQAELERAVAGADSVLFPHDIHASPADVARLLWRGRSVVLLPKGQTLERYLDAATMARLQAVWPRAAGSNIHPWAIATKLVEDTGAGDLFGDDRVTDAVGRAARKHRKKHEAVGVQHANRMLDAYFAGPAEHVGCLEAAVAVAEAGKPAAERRIADWTHSRVPEVAASATERAFDRCWPAGPARTQLRAGWRTALDGRLAAPGVTVAVTPLLYLAEDGGLLDGFAARGLDIQGPRWRAE